jgi:two-component system sensor histidine kinase GlrK
MKLFARFFISHSLPVIIVTLALGVALAALMRIQFVLTTLTETELETLHDEGALHRTAWSLDVAMRHGHLACARGKGGPEARLVVQQRAEGLRRELGQVPGVPQPMHDIVNGYLGVASDMLEGDPCTQLLDAELQARRSQLDEALTNIWVDRLSELHRAVTKKEEEARGVAESAIWTGIPLAVASLFLAMFIARRMAILLKQPLSELALMARRVGDGDFRSPVNVAGPAEVMALAEELERMRSQLEQLETLKQGFLASVSHELRTPLSKIREALALLQDGAVGHVDERQLRVVQIARTACEREIRMVTTLLDLSRLRAGSPIRVRDGSAIDAVLTSAVNDERLEANSRGVELELYVEGESHTCRLDPPLMERAFANLIRNAVSVSSRGQHVRVRRSFVLDPPGRKGPWIRITISDQGPGVPPEIRSKVFDAFVTRAVPNSAKALGIGIGLALAREVARAHGGDLVLADTDEKGATFDMWLPVETEPAERLPAVRRSLGLEQLT